MPARLREETSKVTWRILAADLALFEALFPDNVNGQIRDVLHAYAERLRERMKGLPTPSA